MTQMAQQRFGAGRIAIGVAALALGLAVGISLSRQHAAAPPPAPPGALQPASAQPTTALLEQRAQANPADSGNWQALGGAYFADDRYDDAVRAYESATAHAPGKAVLWSALGEARVMASKTNPMPPEALQDFKRAVALERGDPRARYFLAVKRDLDGDHAGAITDWLSLLADTPHGAPWEADLRRTIEQVGRINHIEVESRLAATEQPGTPLPVAAQAIPGPTQQDLQAAASIPPSQQQAMAEAMVAKLESRLQSDTHDVPGWVMLMRSRVTLGQPAKASLALKQAIAANPDQAATLREQAGVLGVK